MNKLYHKCSLITIVTTLVMAISACKYENIGPGNYPDQKIYMSNADLANNGPGSNGIYSISTLDVPGQVVRYNVDNSKAKFDVLFGVARSGINIKDDVSINLTTSADTINKLLVSGKLTSDTQILPASSFSLLPSVTIADGETSKVFPLSVDLNYLINNPNKKFAIAVSINSTQRPIISLLGTTILLIDTKIFFPAANYTFLVDAGNTRKLNFNNTSTFGLNYTWDFGDGTAIVSDKSPSHVFAAAGTYNVKLTTTGVTGANQQSVITKPITVL